MVRFISAIAGALAIGAAALTLSGAVAGGSDTPVVNLGKEIDSPSGLPVPRFVSLRKSEVRARFGPSFDYPVAYEFHQAGLPLKVIAEDSDNVWRRVEDRDGHRMWIHRSMLMSNENGIVMTENVILRAHPKESAKGRARLTQGVMAKIEECSTGWCRVKAEEFRGWLPQDSLWGAPLKT